MWCYCPSPSTGATKRSWNNQICTWIYIFNALTREIEYSYFIWSCINWNRQAYDICAILLWDLIVIFFIFIHINRLNQNFLVYNWPCWASTNGTRIIIIIFTRNLKISLLREIFSAITLLNFKKLDLIFIDSITKEISIK